MKKMLFWSLLSFVFFACQKEIDIDLNTANPQLVVEGALSDASDTATVRLTRSVNFDDPNTFPAVSGASVTISDQLGNSWELTETAAGMYQHSNLRGVVGNTYYLRIVTANGQSLTAESTMPAAVPLDSISIEKVEFADSVSYFALPHYFDPAEVANQYRFVQILNGKPDAAVLVRNDDVFNGKQNEQPILSFDLDIKSGDELLIEMQNIDPGVYEYFFSLSQIIGTGPDAVATPSNPVSNIKGEALGYFSAYSVRRLAVIVP